MEIQYNCLNLPSRITFENGNLISYLYAANGAKLRSTHVIGNDTTVTDYCGNVVYENGTPKMLLTEVGYVSLDDNRYHYYIRDHQGNNRVVMAQDGTVEEVNDYYPFGGLMASSPANSVQPYKYNGKELDRKGGLDWYDYGARMYDAALGRFMKMDRYAEKYASLSPYQYAANNPVNNIDVNGDSIRVYVETDRHGHFWMSVGEGDDMVVYSYGRFNGTYKGQKGIDCINSLGDGDGVLLRFTGDEAREYMEKKEALGTNAYVVTDLDDAKVAAMLDKKFYSSNKVPDNPQSDYYANSSAHIIDDYKLTSNNCTTFVSDILNSAGSKALETIQIQTSQVGTSTSVVKERFIVPASFNNYLRGVSRQNGIVYRTK